MPQKAIKGKSSAGVMKRKNAPQKRKTKFSRDPKGTRELNKILEERAAAKALRNEAKLNFTISELNQKGKQRITAEDADKDRKKAKKRSSTDRQIEAVEKLEKRSKNDLE